MRERAILAGGRLDVRTTPGGGTTIELALDATGGPAR
jgi:signal transduction histidine kinase